MTRSRIREKELFAAVAARLSGLTLPHPAVAGYVLAAGIWVVGVLVGLVPRPVDAMNFYEHLDRYSQTYASGAGLYYAPPVYQAMSVLAWFGPHVFSAVMVGLGLAALLVVGGKWAWALLFFPPVWWDISSGNVNIIIGVCSIAMLLRPGWIAVPLLTKVTPAVTGLWWVVRREWKPLGAAILAVGSVCLVSFVLDPSLWVSWVAALSQSAGYTGPGYFTIPVPLLPRLVVAAGLVVWAAKTDRYALLPIAAWLAIPVLWWTTLACLVAYLMPKLHLRPTKAAGTAEDMRTTQLELLPA
jgi:hypothetical protein